MGASIDRSGGYVGTAPPFSLVACLRFEVTQPCAHIIRSDQEDIAVAAWFGGDMRSAMWVDRVIISRYPFLSGPDYSAGGRLRYIAVPILRRMFC